MIKLKNILLESDYDATGVSNHITHDNVHTKYNTPPTGYMFTAKQMTEPANRLLRAYWQNVASALEKDAEIKQDRADGVEWKYMSDNYNWLSKYRMRADQALAKLRQGGFIKYSDYDIAVGDRVEYLEGNITDGVVERLKRTKNGVEAVIRWNNGQNLISLPTSKLVKNDTGNDNI
jgi:hypothetical protein